MATHSSILAWRISMDRGAWQPKSMGPQRVSNDWFDFLAVQGTLKSLLQHHRSKASILWCSAFFMVQLSHLYMTTGKTIALPIQTFVGKVAFQSPLSTGILQARLLEWVAMPSSRGSSQPRDHTQVFHTAGGFFTI